MSPSHILTITSLLLSLAAAPISLAADLNKGIEAAQRGDFDAAVSEWKPLAEQGNIKAQVYLAFMYENGKGVPKDYRAAIKWYTASAEQGDASAQNNLALMYDYGKGAPQDYKAAMKWYTASAEQGDASAMLNLSKMYEEGKGVPQDFIQAYMWSSLVAPNGGFISEEHIGMFTEKMTPTQIKEAQTLARKWRAKH